MQVGIESFKFKLVVGISVILRETRREVLVGILTQYLLVQVVKLGLGNVYEVLNLLVSFRMQIVCAVKIGIPLFKSRPLIFFFEY
jgi:hypothetical protein